MGESEVAFYDCLSSIMNENGDNLKHLPPLLLPHYYTAIHFDRISLEEREYKERDKNI